LVDLFGGEPASSSWLLTPRHPERSEGSAFARREFFELTRD